MFRLPLGFAQYVVHLLQCGNQDLPQLIQNLGTAVVPLGIHLLGHFVQCIAHVDGLQKGVQRLYLPPQISSLPEILLELIQGRDGAFPGFIQQFQPLPGIVVPILSQSIRVEFPAFRPAAAADPPDNGIVFHHVAGIRIQRRQCRAKVAQHLPLFKASQSRIQSRQHRADDTALQDLLGTGAVHRNVKAVENQIHQRLIGRHVRTHQGDVPVAAALRNQTAHRLGRCQTLLPRGICVAGMHQALGHTGKDAALKQALTHRLHGRIFPRDRLRDHRHPGLFGHLDQLTGRLCRLFKGQQMGIRAVAGDAYGDTGGNLDQMLDDGQILPGKIRETVYVEGVIPAKAAHFQLFQQPGHLISGIPLAPAAQTVVGFHQQGKLLQLLGKASLRFPGSLHQIRRGNAAALKFIHGINQSCEELRLCLHGGIGLQSAAQLPGRRRHGYHPAAAVQTDHGRIAHVVRHPPGHPGKGQHLGIPAGGIPCPPAEPALHIMADQFRDNEDPPGLFV